MSKCYLWDVPFLYKSCVDQLQKRCIDQPEVCRVLSVCHDAPYEGHFRGTKIAAKASQSCYFCLLLFKDANELVKACDRCKIVGNIFGTRNATH